MAALPPNPQTSMQPFGPGGSSLTPQPPGVHASAPPQQPSQFSTEPSASSSKATMLKIIIAAGVALILGIIIGFIVGRATLERKWSQPYAAITPAEEQKSASQDADPTPKAGTKVMKAMPLARARMAMKAFTANDPVQSPTASFGQGDEGIELHVTVENRGKCKLSNVSGVAYGFDANGLPAAANKHGETYVALNSKLEKPLDPGQKTMVSMKMRYAENATIALAHIDATECTDGPAWKRL